MKKNIYILISLMFLGCSESYQEDTIALNDVTIEYTTLSGHVYDAKKNPLVGVSIHLKHHDISTNSDANGWFSFSNIVSKNDILLMKKEGYYDGIYSYYATNKQELAPFILNNNSGNTVKLIFAGDTSFARRYMDPSSQDRTDTLITQDQDNALLKISDIQGTGQDIINPIKPLFDSADFSILNFESIATSYQQTLNEIHPTKDYAFYSDSLSVPLLKDLTINFVTLGNNHVYDYNAIGLKDTIQALINNQIPYSGAGKNVDEAFAPYRTQIKGKNFSFIGATSIRGEKHKLLYVAHEQDIINSDSYISQGGAADARDTKKIASTLRGEDYADYFPIYQLHGGIEYTYGPNYSSLKRFKSAIYNKASLVISHHPHTAQGYGMYKGVLMAYGMGNFIFDQDRLDTLLSHILVCDINESGVTRAIGYPIYIEDYIPKFLTGDLANTFIKHISEASRNGSTLNETKYTKDFLLFPYQYKEYLILNDTYTKEIKNIELNVSISSKGYETLDLRHLLSSEYSLSSATVNSNALKISMGRDLLWFGSFEDDHVDDNFFENSIWNFGNSVATSQTAYKGKASAHLLRDESHIDDALLYFGKRIRVIGDARNRSTKELSFLGYFKGVDSQNFSIESRYFASIGEKTFGNTLLFKSQGGTFDWKKLDFSIPMPKDKVISDDPKVYLSENARALKFYIRMNSTQKGSAHLYVDDLAIISWEETNTTQESITLSTPHAREFLKLSGPVGRYTLSLKFSRYLP
ncbi:CapA family protein [Sulfurimonas sp. MAG313]|nr:CapA family protein [Sulfurimonas sp. MAG313]MDF1881518.1 CapA family protein [Sulfurimonas sp. MAG313]